MKIYMPARMYSLCFVLHPKGLNWSHKALRGSSVLGGELSLLMPPVPLLGWVDGGGVLSSSRSEELWGQGDGWNQRRSRAEPGR